MKHVEPNVFLIAKTEADYPEMRNWLDCIGADEFELPPEKTTAIGTLLASLAGKRCYMSYQPGLNPNVTKVREDLSEFIDNILKVGHGSVIEHVNYTFAIENVSRIFTAEMNRHRAGVAISEGSMRYIRFEDIPFWMPHEILDQSWLAYAVENLGISPDDSPIDTGFYENPVAQEEEIKNFQVAPIERFVLSEVVLGFADWKKAQEAKRKSRAVFNRAFQQMEDNYKELLAIWDYESLKTFKEKKQLTSMFRRIIGMGGATGGVWTGNLRALRHIFTMRCDPAAEEEICYVASMMLERMIEAEPDMFADFHKVDGYWQPKYWKV